MELVQTIMNDPLEVPERYVQKLMHNFIDYEPRRTYHAMVKYLDDVVGNLTTAIKQCGL